jgi:hypothetical protein
MVPFYLEKKPKGQPGAAGSSVEEKPGKSEQISSEQEADKSKTGDQSKAGESQDKAGVVDKKEKAAAEQIHSQSAPVDLSEVVLVDAANDVP